MNWFRDLYDEWKFLIALIALVFGCAIGAGIVNNQLSEQAFLDGKEAYELKINPEANPYTDNDYCRRAWLNGYISKKKSSE